MIDKMYDHEGYCKTDSRKDRKDYHKTVSMMFFLNAVVVVIISLITFAVSFIGGLLVKFFIL